MAIMLQRLRCRTAQAARWPAGCAVRGTICCLHAGVALSGQEQVPRVRASAQQAMATQISLRHTISRLLACLPAFYCRRAYLPACLPAFAGQLPSRKLEVELTTVSSNYHVEMNPSDVGNNDRYVVQVRGSGHVLCRWVCCAMDAPA